MVKYKIVKKKILCKVEKHGLCNIIYIPKGFCTIHIKANKNDYFDGDNEKDGFCLENLGSHLPCQNHLIKGLKKQNMTYNTDFYYAYDNKIKRKVPHVRLNNDLISLVTGSKTTFKRVKNG